MLYINTELNPNRPFKTFIHHIHSKSEDILFSIIQKLPERFISPSLMDWLERYINKRTAELHHQITKSKWQQADLESTLTKLYKQHPQDTNKK